MAKAIWHRGEGIIEFDTTNSDFDHEEPGSGSAPNVVDILFSATAAGAYTFVWDGVSITLNSGTGFLTSAIPFHRRVHTMVLSGAPVGGKMRLMLERRPASG